MANKRVITSSIFEDDFFGSLDMMQRLLWIGLFSRCADDQGRLVDNPVVIRSQVFPYDDIPAADIDAALNVYAAEGKIIRYKDDRGRGFIQLVRWWENQAPQWAMPSKYPAPDGWPDRVRSYIKGVYHCENWPDKQSKQQTPPPPPDEPPQVVPPGGSSSLSPQVAGHDPNPEINPDPDHILNNKREGEPADPFDRIVASIERHVGLPVASEADVKACQKMVQLGAIDDDIRAAVVYFRDEVKKPARGADHILDSVKYQIRMRAQAGVKGPPGVPRSNGTKPTAPTPDELDRAGYKLFRAPGRATT